MEIKCKNYPKYRNLTYLPNAQVQIHPTPRRACVRPNENAIANTITIRPVTSENVTGLSALRKGLSEAYHSVSSAIQTYKQNILHTYEHKLIFAIIEKQIFGKNSIDSLTHDSDKLLLYTLGFPKSFVSKFHRKHSVHHTESGKTPNLRSMLVDNIASSPDFKPEKKLSLRNYFKISKELQGVEGFKEILERYNFGENLNFEQIKNLKKTKYNGTKGIGRTLIKTLALIF